MEQSEFSDNISGDDFEYHESLKPKFNMTKCIVEPCLRGMQLKSPPKHT